MRIGLFTDTYCPQINGVATSVNMLKKGLEKKGNIVYLVTVNPDKYEYSIEENGKVLRLPGVPIKIYDYKLASVYPLKAINIIKKWRLDVIHSHTEFGVGTFARIIATQFGIPLVHTYHTMYEDYVHYITHGYFNWSSKKIVEYLTLFYCDKTNTELIVPTVKACNLFKEKYHVDRDVYVIPTGIDTERFSRENNKKFNKKSARENLNLKMDDFVILTVGRIAQEKNITFIIDNMKKIVKKCPKAKLLIVGDGPDFDKCKKLISKYKIDNNVIMTGKVPYDKIVDYYLLADIFVTASTTETQGLTVIEAMAASLPVVCINDESFLNVVIDDINGKIFSGSSEYIKDVCMIYNDRKLLERLSRQAKISTEMYSIRYFASKVEDVYRIAIKNYHRNLIPIFDKIKSMFGGKNK